jgi:radical SAM protein with 4Fe4S-binding SPASM domain
MDRLYFQWHITDTCNFRCQHCYQNKFDSTLELDIKGLKSVSDRIIDVAGRRKSKAVLNITGGEPFLKKELFPLLAYLDSFKEIAQLIVITNASLIDYQIIKKLKRVKKLNQIKVSLDGANSFTNDAIRGRGAFDKAIEAIRRLKEKSDFSIVIMFTIMKSNLREIFEIFKLGQKLRLDGLILERFFPMGAGLKIKDQLLDRRDWFNLNKTLVNLTGQRYSPYDMLKDRAFWIRYRGLKIELLGASCNISKDSFCIMPNADVFPCRRFCLRLGNLLENSLDEITNSSLLNDIINARPKGMCGECDIADCRGCPALSLLLTGDYLSGDFQCWYGREIS